MLLLWLAACRGAAPPPPDSGLSFVESAPPTPGPARLVVAIHGLGDVPGNLIALVRRCGLPVRVIAPRGPIRHGDGFSWFDVRFDAAGAHADAARIAEAGDRVALLIDALAAREDVVGKPIVTGFSQGAILSFAIATRHPGSVAGAVPVAGTLPPELEVGPADAGAPPIRALHGDSDPVVPLAPTRDLIHRLEAAGWDATLRTFPGVEHAIPEAVHASMCAELAAMVQ